MYIYYNTVVSLSTTWYSLTTKYFLEVKTMENKKVRKAVNTTLDKDLYNKIQVLAFKLSAENGSKINANDLLEEGMELILNKYQAGE